MKIQTFAWPLVLLFGCIDPYSPAISRDQKGLLVVDGVLIAGDSSFFRLSRTEAVGSPLLSRAENKAILWIEEERGGKTYRLHEKSNGIYFLPPTDLNVSGHYRLRIQTFANAAYESEYVEVKRSPPIDSLTWKEEGDKIQFYVSTHDLQNEAIYYRWRYLETWQYSSLDYSKFVYSNGKVEFRSDASELYNCWHTKPEADIFIYDTRALTQDHVIGHPLFSIEESDRKLYYGYSLLLTQYALTERAYHYWRQTQSYSDDLGTLHDPMPGQVYGNIHAVSNSSEIVVGFFSATSISQKRIFLTRQQLRGPAGLYSPSGYENCETFFLPLESYHSLMGGKVIIDASYSPNTQELTGYIVSTVECMDCRKKGGTNHKPAFWK